MPPFFIPDKQERTSFVCGIGGSIRFADRDDQDTYVMKIGSALPPKHCPSNPHGPSKPSLV